MKKRVLIMLAGILIVAITAFAVFQMTPWPGAMLIRYEFDKGGQKIAEALEKHVPTNITSVLNQQYKSGNDDAFLDVFYPKQAESALPTIAWAHGGAWVSGNKNDTDNYLKILASHGYTTVSINYSIAPEKKYPTPVIQVNEALAYLQENAERLNINPNKIILGGDSAGSQIMAQVAVIITNPSYAREMGLEPSLKSRQLKAVILACGAYDLNLPDYSGPDGEFLRTVLWAYSGTRDFLTDPKMRQASVIDYVTKDFPPAFLTAGNADPLEAQSKEMAEKLKRLGVLTTTLFYPKDHEPKLQHEYQFNLDIADGRKALHEILDFIKTYSSTEKTKLP